MKKISKITIPAEEFPMLTIICRKSTDIHALEADMKTLMNQFHNQPEEVHISRIVELSHEEFYDFKENLLEDRDWLQDARVKGARTILVKEENTSNQKGIIVQTSGYEYARYAGLPMQEVDYKKCPRCGKIYFEHPAISRADNKTEICPECGAEEALIQAGFTPKFIKELERLQKTATDYKVRIEVKVPEYENGKKRTRKIVIDPDIGYN